MSRFAPPSPEELAREGSTTEKSSQSNWRDVAAKHCTIEWVVDFGAETLRGAVTFDEVTVKTAGGAAESFERARRQETGRIDAAATTRNVRGGGSRWR